MAFNIRWDQSGVAPWWRTRPRDDLSAELQTLNDTLERLTAALERFIQFQIEGQVEARRLARERDDQ